MLPEVCRVINQNIHLYPYKLGEYIACPLGNLLGNSLNLTLPATSTSRKDVEEESIAKVVEGVLGVITNPIMCSTCQDVASEIAKTKESIRNLQQQLALAVGRLSDLATLGKRLVEEDIAQGGLCSLDGDSVVVRVVEEGRLDPALPALGLPVLAQYRGRLSTRSLVNADDGSSPEISKDEDCGGVWKVKKQYHGTWLVS